MDKLKDFVTSNLNPFLPLAKFIYRAALGKIMHTENVDATNFLKNGLANLKLDPEKVNRLLKGVPVKVVEGYISEVRLRIDTKAMKISVVVGKVSLITYMDDHSQFTSKNENGENYVAAEALGVSSDTGEDPTSSGGFFESLISSFELGLTIEAIEVELRTERYVRNSSKFSIELEKIDIKKVKQKSPSIIHSIQGSLGGLEIKFQQIGDSSAKKFLALQRIIRKDEPLMCSEAFSLTMEVMKCPGKDSERRLVTRGNLASVQVVTTLLTALELFKLVDKALLFMMRQTYSQQGISELLEFYKNHRHEENFQDIEEENFMSVRGSALFNSVYQSCRNTNRDLKDSFFGSSKLTPSSITASKTPEAFDNFQNDFKEAKLDLEFRWQGLYLGVLKVHRFDTDNLFTWITTLDKATKLNFSSTLYSHFLLRAEKITLSYMSSEKSNSVIVGNLEVVDCSTASNGKASVNSRDHSFSNRVEIEGLDSYSMNNSMSSDDSSLFKSTIGFGSDEGKTNYSEYSMFSLDPLPQSGVSGEPQALKVKFETEGILSLGISIHKIKINFDMDSFKMMTDRVAMYDEIMNVCQLVANEKRRGESEAFKQNEARLLFEGLSAYDFKQVISDLDKLQAGLKEEKIKNEFIKLFNIILPHTLAQAQTAKIDVDISGIEFKVGGIIDAGLNKQAFVLLRAGGIHLLIQKMVLLSWKNSIEVGIETEIGRQLCLQITGDKENLIGIDEQKMIVKLSAVDVHLSPAIFEGILTIVQYIATKLSRLEYNHQKYQIIGSLEALLDLQKKTYVTFSEELEINSKVRAIEQELLSAPAFVEKLYVYLGKVSLKIFDEEITKDIIESSIAQRRRLISDFEDWTVIDEDEVERPYQDIALSDIEKKEKELKQLNVVIHLELKPIMVVQKIGRNPSLMLFIHTIMLLDGMTYLNMKENKLNYQTHFCEIYSINYNQPCFDANLSKRFRVTECIRMFHEVHKRFKTEKPFLQLEQKLDYDIEHQRHIQKTEINMSSIIFRLSMATSKETFVCLIRIVDSTLARLDAISDLFTKLREANTTEDMKAFHEKQSQKAMMKNQEKVMEMGSIFSFDVDSIFLDIFDPSRYRLVLKVAKSHISVDDNPSLKSPIKIECNSVQAAFTTKRDFTGKKDVDDFLNKEIYFKVLKLHTMIVGITTDVEDKVPTTDITITLPSNEEKKNLLLMIDLDSLAVFMEISATFTSLLESARSKTQFLFKDLSEYRDRFPEVPPKRESLDWEKVGVKYPEVMAMKDHFKLISDGMTESFQMDTDSKDEKESIQSKIQGNIHKMDESLKVLENIYIEKLSDKVSNLNLKLTIDKITVNIYQQYDFISHSYVSLKIFGLLFVMRSTSSSCETSRKSEKTVVTSSRILSLRSLKILDNTKDSWFKYLLKVPKHSLCLFFRDRTVSEKTVKKESTLQKPTYLVESYKDKVAFIMDLNPIEIFLDDKSADSLKTFTERLIEMLKAKTPEESLYQSEATGMKEDRKSQEASFLLDYFFISNLSLQLIARSATNLSFVNYIPDVNINIDEKMLEVDDPITWDEVTKFLLGEVKRDLSLKNILKDNKNNIPLLASFYSLCSSVNTIYCAVSHADGAGALDGMKQLVILIFVTCLKTGQFGLRSLGDIASIIGKAAFNSKLINFDNINRKLESLVNSISGNKSTIKSSNTNSLRKYSRR